MMMSFRNICGIVLVVLMTISALLAILGIWGMVESEQVCKLLSTFFVVGGATIGLSYVTNTFFGKKVEKETSGK